MAAKNIIYIDLLIEGMPGMKNTVIASPDRTNRKLAVIMDPVEIDAGHFGEVNERVLLNG